MLQFVINDHITMRVKKHQWHDCNEMFCALLLYFLLMLSLVSNEAFQPSHLLRKVAHRDRNERDIKSNNVVNASFRNFTWYTWFCVFSSGVRRNRHGRCARVVGRFSEDWQQVHKKSKGLRVLVNDGRKFKKFVS